MRSKDCAHRSGSPSLPAQPGGPGEIQRRMKEAKQTCKEVSYGRVRVRWRGSVPLLRGSRAGRPGEGHACETDSPRHASEEGEGEKTWDGGGGQAEVLLGTAPSRVGLSPTGKCWSPRRASCPKEQSIMPQRAPGRFGKKDCHSHIPW